MDLYEGRETSTEQAASVASTPDTPSDKPLDPAAAAHFASRAAVDGVVYGACVAVPWGKRVMGGDSVNLPDAMKALRKSVDAVNAGDLSQAEGLLLAQASALNGIFTVLARRAAHFLDSDMGAVDFSLRLAFKAQAQSRATLETLANVKNPKAVAFVRQANIAHGPQQVNNDGKTPAQAVAHVEEAQTPQNELLENQHGERLDFRTAGAAGRIDPHLEAVGAVYRAQ